MMRMINRQADAAISNLASDQSRGPQKSCTATLLLKPMSGFNSPATARNLIEL
jgi:hypothetical protein